MVRTKRFILPLLVVLSVADAGNRLDLTKIQRTHLEQVYPTDYVLEHPLHTMELLQQQRLRRMLKDKVIHIGGFYHIGPNYKYWRQVIREQLKLLDGFYLIPRNNATYQEAADYAHDFMRPASETGTRGGLMSLADDLFIGLHGREESRFAEQQYILSLNLSYIDRVRFEHRNLLRRFQWRSIKDPRKREALRAEAARMDPVATEGEYHTIEALHKYCKAAVAANRTTVVFYFHTKTMNEGRQLAPGSCWRDAMNAYTLEFPSICLRALLEGYSTCGPFLGTNIYMGNFWWASCNHVANLPGLWDPIDNAMNAEEFLHNVSWNWGGARQWYKNLCAYGSYSVKANMYRERVVRESYLLDIHDKIAKDTLPPSLGRANFQTPDDKLFHGEPCYSVKSDMSQIYPYQEHRYYLAPVNRTGPYHYAEIKQGTVKDWY